MNRNSFTQLSGHPSVNAEVRYAMRLLLNRNDLKLHKFVDCVCTDENNFKPYPT